MIVLTKNFWENLPKTVKDSIRIVVIEEDNLLKIHDANFISLCNYISTEIPKSTAYKCMVHEYKNILEIVRSYKEGVAA